MTATPPTAARPATPTPRLVAVVRRRPLLAFFTLAFALSWLAWTPYVLSAQGLGIVPLDFPSLLGTTQLVGVLPGAYLGPLGAAWLVTRLADGRPGVRVWLGRVTRWRVGWRWWLGVLVGVPAALAATGVLVFGALDEVAVPPAAVLLLYVPMLLLQVITTGVAEEPGWRDFALPRLQPRYGPVRGTLLLGILWGLWHLPLFLTEWGGVGIRAADVVAFVLGAVTVSLVMTWVFNRTGESLPVAVVLHAGINTFFTLAWTPLFGDRGAGHSSSTVLLVASGLVAVVLLVATRGTLGYRPGARDASTGRIATG